ncbi:hypothetical protein [Flexivirga alba]|uniref:Signal transduction histidine kinase subgroup 3 dimerisation and phosphoacceptor domain-containing protein n=1 Tax=Flexivirga alba TaxID=702742 RepID=A0ABW2ACF9_9MICO
MRHTGTALGEIVVEGDDNAGALSSWDRRMLDTLARPAGAALSTVRLTVELRQRKTELERLTAALRASRERLLTARATEQQRMRAEVATRVGTHVSAALAAVGDCRVAAPGESLLESPLATAAREAELALDELRNIARGIYPPTLAEVGLAASLESWLARARVDATLEVTADLGSLPVSGASGVGPEVAACLYFCAVTSLGHLARHRASAIRVGISARPCVVLSLEAHVAGSVGSETIELVTDRIEAFGGSVRSELGDNEFAVTATLPGSAGVPT